jgi:hypothetical protein
MVFSKEKLHERDIAATQMDGRQFHIKTKQRDKRGENKA